MSPVHVVSSIPSPHLASILLIRRANQYIVFDTLMRVSLLSGFFTTASMPGTKADRDRSPTFDHHLHVVEDQ